MFDAIKSIWKAITILGIVAALCFIIFETWPWIVVLLLAK